jgi:hypothetical protein
MKRKLKYIKSLLNDFNWFLIIIIILVSGFALLGCGSLNPRTNSIFHLQFSEQPPRTLIDLTCQGQRHIYEGVAVCEEKSEKNLQISVKIMPVPGRVVFSDGLTKKTIDFNWRKGGWLWWDHVIIDTTWVPIDFGKISSIFGDVPLAFDVQGLADSGVINNRGVIYTRICNDKDIPCSKLLVKFDCAGQISNTYENQMGACARMSGSSQKFSIPLKSLSYEFKEGAKIRVQSGRDEWKFKYDVTAADLKNGEVKFVYPNVQTGPDLFTITVFQYEQGVLQEYHAYILLVGSSPDWTGIDKPHFMKAGNGYDICMPITSDLMEIGDSNSLTSLTKDCVNVQPSGQLCAFAFDRESNDTTYTCLKNGKEVRFP